MVGQRHRGVANLGRERLDQEGGDRTVHHRHEQHQDEDQSGQDNGVVAAAVGRELVHHLEDRDRQQSRKQAAGQNHRLAPHPIRQRAENYEEGRSERERHRDDDLRRFRRNPGSALAPKPGERVELARVPHDRLPCHHSPKHGKNRLPLRPRAEAVTDWRLGGVTSRLHLLEERRLLQSKADEERETDEEYRDQKRYAPTPGVEGFRRHCPADKQDYQQRHKQAKSCCGLDVGCVIPAPVVGHVLGYIRRCAAVLTA